MLCIYWICAVASILLLLPNSECYEDHAQIISYERHFLYGLASAAPSRLKPPALPEWVPLRDGKDDNDTCSSTTTRVRKRGKKGGVRQRVRLRRNKPPLPTITLANVRSIGNKIDEIRALTRYNGEFRWSSILCFTETWLNPSIPDESIDIDGFELIRLDRSIAETGKSKGGGVGIYMNRNWCKNYTTRSLICQENIELLCVSFRPFYLPREFGQVHTILVYIPPDANADAATGVIAETVNSLATASPDAPVIILGDFNQCRIEDVLPNYQQTIDCVTRGNNVLDRCYCSVQDAYKSVPRPSIGKSDHLTVHLLPKYKQIIKREKAKAKTVKVWNEAAIENLQTCFELTDWNMLISSAVNLDEAVEIVNGYILFCQDLHVCNRVFKTFPNQKPWVRKQLKDMLKQKRNAFLSNNADELKSLNRKIKVEINDGKNAYKVKLENEFRSNNTRNAWKCMQTMTGYKKKQSNIPNFSCGNVYETANELNRFYARFDTESFDDVISRQYDELQRLDDAPISCAFSDVVKHFKKTNPRKSMGPDNICGKMLKACAWQLATPFCTLFQKSLDQNYVPLCWKSAVIIPVAKTSQASQPNDFRPIALTSLVMKSFERIVLQYLFSGVLKEIDVMQFAYQPKKCVNDAILILTHLISQHIDKVSSRYVRITFVDFSSAFNTLRNHVLVDKLRQMTVKSSLILWIQNFLSNRTQRVKVLDKLSESITINTGSPQGCVLSAPLFILYTNDCKATRDGVKIVKYADDTAIVGLISQNELNYRCEVNRFQEWCKQNFLHLNTSKTKEMIFDFRTSKRSELLPIVIKDSDIEIVETYKYLGTVIDNRLTWADQCKAVLSKSQQRMYFLRKLKAFHVDRTILRLFYESVIESVLLFSCVVWYGGCRKKDFSKLQRISKQAGKITGDAQNLQVACESKIIAGVKQIMQNENHPLFLYYVFMRSGKRLRSMNCRTQRFLNSFVPLSIRLYNQTVT